MVCIILGLEAIGAVWWIVVLVALITLPAALDVMLNLQAKFELSDERIFWKNRSQEVTIPLGEVEKVIFDGRMDRSVRVSIAIVDGRKIRVPYDALPPDKDLQKELEAREIRIERNSLTFF